MTDYLVGTGGWQYFTIPEKHPLKAYSEIFNFVEVNNTFYQYPSPQTVQRWRKTVPADFTFSVRCHQDLTHRIGLKPINEAYEVFYKAKLYAQILQTPYVVLETPFNYMINNSTTDFLSTLNLKGLNLIWEYRALTTAKVVNLMRDFKIIQSVDLSKQKPNLTSEVAYSRLFGKGKQNIYQFTNDELEEIHKQAQETGSKKILLSYHGIRMYTDAIRFQTHLKTGHFISATSSTGADSAKAVLKEDALFPSSKAELIDKQGWKVIDITKNQTAHLSKYLSQIPDKTYPNLDELVKELQIVL